MTTEHLDAIINARATLKPTLVQLRKTSSTNNLGRAIDEWEAATSALIAALEDEDNISDESSIEELPAPPATSMNDKIVPGSIISGEVQNETLPAQFSTLSAMSPPKSHVPRSRKQRKVAVRRALLSNSVSEKNFTENTHQTSRIGIMANAFGSSTAYLRLKEALISAKTDRDNRMLQLNSNSHDAQVLTNILNSLESDSAVYVRRFTLVLLHQCYLQRCISISRKGNRVSKMDKATVIEDLINTCDGVPFPELHRSTAKDQQGCIDSNERSALQWNTSRRRLIKRLGAGQRWGRIESRFGSAALGLIAPDWDSANLDMTISDDTFEHGLTNSEVNELLDSIDNDRARRLEQAGERVKGHLSEALTDPEQARRWCKEIGCE